MKPEGNANFVFATIRARAKMHEFKAHPDDFNKLPYAPSSLLALAIGILGDAAAALSDKFLSGDRLSGRPIGWDDDDGSIPEMVRFSAQYFDAFLEGQFDQDQTNEFALLCATSYYLSDSVGSAAVVMRRSPAPNIELGHGLANLAYSILRNELDPNDNSSYYNQIAAALLQALNAFYQLRGSYDRVVQLCNQIRKLAYSAGSARELLYGDIVVALCARKFESACRTLIPKASSLPESLWEPALTKAGFPNELWPAQKLLCAENILRGRSAVVQMPTSAGKTRSTEFIIRAHFLAGRSNLVVIVAPFRSLCHDIRSDLVKAFSGEAVLIDEVSDSYLFDIDLEEVRKQDAILVVTPEKMLYMYRRAPELAASIGLIIYDEGHQFDGLARGPTYELLLASMRLSLPKTTQVILISAVIGNATDVADWLLGDKNAVVSGSNLLPTVRNIAFASWKSTRALLQYVSPQNPDAEEFFVPRVFEASLLDAKPRERVEKRFPQRGANTTSTDVGLFLGLHLVGNGSVAIFCGKKESVGTICKRAVEIHSRGYNTSAPLTHSNAAEVAKVAKLATLHLGSGSSAASAASLGIFSHHSNTPTGLRLSIEHAMKAGHAKIVVCTSTLAQGVNFPIRYLIVTATQQGKEEIKVRDFHNLMGRAGRAGMYTEGNVIFSSPSLIDEKSGNGQWRWEKTKKLLDSSKSEPSTSSILELFKNYKQTVPLGIDLDFAIPASWLDLTFATPDSIELMVAAAIKRFSNLDVKAFARFLTDRARAVQSIAAYLASYVDFYDEGALGRVDKLAENTLAYHLSAEATRLRLLEVFRSAAKAIQGGADLALVKLVRKSPLPPAAVKSLHIWISSNIGFLVATTDEALLFKTLLDQALLHTQARALEGISPSLIAACLALWLDGKPYHLICAPLTAAKMKIGVAHATPDHVVNICENGFGYGLAMALAAIADLVEDQSPTLSQKIATLQKRVKYGLPSDSSIAFYEAGFADRVVAQALSAVFPKVVTKYDVKDLYRVEKLSLDAILSAYPDYFSFVARELT